MTSARLICVPPSLVLPASTITADIQRVNRAVAWLLATWRWLLCLLGVLALVCLALWQSMYLLRPSSTALSAFRPNAALSPSLPSIDPTIVALPERDELVVPEPALPAPTVAAPIWRNEAADAERWPSDYAPIDDREPVRVRVVTISAKVTAYTAFDHAFTKPEWADGLVAWYPAGRKRHVSAHPYGFATDWGQFPGGATYIHVPGYLSQAFPDFPAGFRVVDDKCGQSRKVRRSGGQPIIDARFVSRSSAIGGPNAWGTRLLNVEVIYPDGYRMPADLRRWVVACEWHTYHEGQLVQREPAPLP
jgi:hypothetical protein